MVPPTSAAVDASDQSGGTEDIPSKIKAYQSASSSQLSALPSLASSRSSESSGSLQPSESSQSSQPSQPPRPSQSSQTSQTPRTFPTALGVYRSPQGHSLQVDRDATYYGTCRPVDRFEKISRVGEGTYGVVYKKGGWVCALKRIRMDQEQDGLPLSSMREITMLRRIRHENVVSVEEVVVGGRPDEFYMVMEYCAQDLGTLLDHMPNPYTRAEVKCLTLQLLRGLAHCHRLGIIHRDLKMSNLLLTSNGILKIADFGLARLVPKDSGGHLSPKVVTLWYRAPELLFGADSYGFPIDLWSVGCIVAELLRHQPLLPGSVELEQIRLIVGMLGPPHEGIWEGWNDLQRRHPHPYSWPRGQVESLRKIFPSESSKTISLLQGLLTYDPSRRMSLDVALEHPYFNESPRAVDPAMLPTFPEIRVEVNQQQK
ncbi:kinase-like domain-containing protein [Piptocephalis cylindrospora]|uniref:Kinase-like domain-containing protein n=1 Tax=Piptocephalis cylindrospora TaxID=1907219 RepID=A0A4P9Y8U7_9FUNG|nr:kinase-like domain-containing protein [Piptocephalis cylindrospora]|eukprot:RKP14410.1 kinase-like domain-containing protein [Piptocephalis cylindrospora]